MKTLLFTLEYPPFNGGIANYYGNLIKYWPSQGEISVLDNSNNLLLNKWLYPKWLPAIAKLYKTIRRKKIEHILIGQILPLGTAAYLTTRMTNTPYTVFLHGMDISFARKKKRKESISKKILIKSKYIICASSYTRELAIDFIGEKYKNKIFVVNPGISLDNKIENIKVKENIIKKYNLTDKVILFSIGRLVKRKGFDKVIESMPEVLKHIPNLYYYMAGDGPDKKYLYNKARGVKNIIYLGKLDEVQKWAWLDLCDIFITPARKINGDFEGFGIVFLEANICGKPVIAGDSGGIKDAVKGAFSGFIVDPENIGRIAGAIISLAGDNNLRKKIGEQGRERAIKEFDWKNQIIKIHNIINNKNQF